MIAAKTLGPGLMPALRYRDVAAAINWLCRALSFEEHFVARDDKDNVLYAQLTFGNSMIMVGPVQDSPLDQLMKQPDEIGGAETQSCYFVVTDADAHYARATAEGAEIVLELKDYEYGGRGYTCRDPEGHIWTFGTFDPWTGQPVGGETQLEELAADDQPPLGRALSRAAAEEPPLHLEEIPFEEPLDPETAPPGSWLRPAAAGAAIALAAFLLLTGTLYAAHLWPFNATDTAAVRELQQRLTRESMGRILAARSARTANETAAQEKAAKEETKRMVQALRQELVRERNARQKTTDQLEQARAEMVQVQATKDAADAMAQSLQENLAQEKKALAEEKKERETAERTAQAARDDLMRERKNRESVERTLQAVRDELAKERKTREGAERTAQALRDELAKERKALETAGKNAQGVHEELAKEKKTRETAERALQNVRQDLSRMTNAKEQAERAGQKLREELSRERNVKEDALRKLEQLRKKLAENAQAAAEAATTGSTTPAGEAPPNSAAKANPEVQAPAPAPAKPRHRGTRRSPKRGASSKGNPPDSLL